MNHVDISGWYNSLIQELRSHSSRIEKVSRRSEYWRKSNLDIVSNFAQDTSQIDLTSLKGTSLHEPDLIIHGDMLESVSERNYQVLNIMDVIADEKSFAKAKGVKTSRLDRGEGVEGTLRRVAVEASFVETAHNEIATFMIGIFHFGDSWCTVFARFNSGLL